MLIAQVSLSTTGTEALVCLKTSQRDEPLLLTPLLSFTYQQQPIQPCYILLNFILKFISMEINRADTSIVLSGATLIGLLTFIRKASSSQTKMYENIKSNQHRITNLDKELDEIRKEFNISEIRERLARIEAMLQIMMDKK